MDTTVDNLSVLAGHTAAAIGAKVKGLMRAEGLSQRGLAERGGLSLSVVNDLVNGRYSAGTAIGTFEKVARALGTSVGELFGGSQPVESPAEQLDLLRRLDRGDSAAFAELRQRLDDLSALLASAPLSAPAVAAVPERAAELPPGVWDHVPDEPSEPAVGMTLRPQLELLGSSDALLVPLYGHAAAGLGAYNEPVPAAAEVERIPVPRALRPHDGVLIATQVRGDSMEPELYAGDLVVVHYPELQPALALLTPGALVAVTLMDGGEWLDYVKRVALDPRTGMKVLASTNPAYAPLLVTPRELRFVGAVRMTLRG